jgi:hypothetical protein
MNENIEWTDDDRAKDMPARLAEALRVSKESLPAVIRTGLIIFVEHVEQEGVSEFPRFSAAKASAR